MHSVLVLSALALALSHHTYASPIIGRQDSLILADTVDFIAKTRGSNLNPDALPDINNWRFTPIHSGAGQNVATLIDPTTNSFNLSAPGYFRNGTDVSHGGGATMTAGLVTGTVPYSLVLAIGHDDGSSNPGAMRGTVQFNAGIGTNGLDVPAGQLITSNYVTDAFWACPNVPVEGSTAIVVEVTNRYANVPKGCWQIELYAQCAGKISDGNRAAFPAFAKSSCYADASSVIVDQSQSISLVEGVSLVACATGGDWEGKGGCYPQSERSRISYTVYINAEWTLLHRNCSPISQQPTVNHCHLKPALFTSKRYVKFQLSINTQSSKSGNDPSHNPRPQIFLSAIHNTHSASTSSDPSTRNQIP